MWRRLASVLLFLVIATLVIACEAISHANDYSTSSSGIDNCAEGTLYCGGKCIPEDAQNCTACNEGCPANQVCSNGVCGSQCTAGLVQCGDLCIDTLTDPANCGGCGGTADAGTSCPFCQQGMCQSQCAAPSTVCGTLCVDTTSDPKNCGICGTTCKGDTPLCDRSKCVASCGADETPCNGGCADTVNDPKNCGGCTMTGVGNDHHCPSPPITNPITGAAACLESTCVVACAEGLTYCQEAGNPVCVDVTSNALHCGNCSTNCTVTGTGNLFTGKCIAGGCQTVTH